MIPSTQHIPSAASARLLPAISATVAAIAFALVITPGAAAIAQEVPATPEAEAQEVQAEGIPATPEAEAETQAEAQEPADKCGLRARAEELNAIRTDRSLSYLEEMRAEAEARRRFLAAIIACDEEEIAAARQALEGLSDEMKKLPAYAKAQEGLAQAAAYYGDRKGALDELGLQGTKSMARGIADWREGSYAPVIALAENFILWAGNQEFLDRASGRLNQVNRLAFSLKLVNQDEASRKLEDAKDKLRAAFEENDKAREALNLGEAANGLAHIQASLKALSDTYKIFLEMQDGLKDIVR